MAKKPENGNGTTSLTVQDVDKPRDKPRLIPQAHGGALRNGGTNKGGPGRPPDAVRALCLGSFAARLKVLRDIADGEPVLKTMLGTAENPIEATVSASPADRIKALDVLAKYGLGIKKEVEHSGGQIIEVVVRNESQRERVG